MTEKFVTAEEHMLHGEYNQAIEIFDDMLEISPSNTKLLNASKDCLWNSNDWYLGVVGISEGCAACMSMLAYTWLFFGLLFYICL